MTIQEAVRAWLLTRTAVTAITSTIRVDALDQRDKPDVTACILMTVDRKEYDTQNTDGKSDLVQATMMISAISGGRDSSEALAEAIRINGTDPGTGLMGSRVRSGGLNFDAMLESQDFGYIQNIDGSDSGLFSVDSQYTVFYYQTI
jgi:hypothetical protein